MQNKIHFYFLIAIIFCLLVQIIFLTEYCQANVAINEVMPNPSDNCSDCTEWLELFSTSYENLTNWKLNTGESNNLTINVTINDYLVITDDKETFLSFWNIPQEKVIELNIGLTNSGDNIKLYNPIGELTDSFNYNSSTENRSWARCDDNIFILCSYPTPGFENNCSQQTNQTNETNSTNQTNEESSIELLDYPEDAEFGDIIKIDFHVYKGDTGKYAVYAYLENEDEDKVSEKITVHAGNSSSSSKFKDYYFENVEIELKCIDDSGDYDLVISGLDAEERTEISIDACKEETSITPQTTGESAKIEYYVLNQESAKIGDTIQTTIRIINNEDKENAFSVWSYVYRASKCYSCLDTREENAQEITIPENLEAEILLENSVEEADDGNYSLKVKILKGGLKTPREFTFPIYLYGSFLEQDISENVISGSIMKNFDENGNYIEINSKKSILLESLPYIISSIAMLFCIFILVKKI